MKPAKKKKNPPPFKPEPWDKQEAETAKSYAAFCEYRNMGPSRSFSKLAEIYVEKKYIKTTSKPHQKQAKLSTRIRQFATWSSKYNWVSRAESWDLEQDRIERAEQEKTVRDMKQRLADQARVIQTKGLQRIIDLNPLELNRREALDYFVKGVEIEAKYREVPDLKIEHTGQITTTNLGFERIIAEDPETREMIDEILTRLATQQSGGVRISGERREMDSG
jgi:hypothetical protein